MSPRLHDRRGKVSNLPRYCEERTCTDGVRLGKQVGRYVFNHSLKQ